MPRFLFSTHLSELGEALVRDHGLDGAEKATRSALERVGGNLVAMYIGFEDGLRHYIVADVPDEATIHALALAVTANKVNAPGDHRLVRLISVDEARHAAETIKSWGPPAGAPPMPPGQ